MKSLRTVGVIAAVAVAVMVGFIACGNPLARISSGTKEGTLTVSFTNTINTRTLLPPLSMNAASYSVSGSGPGGATFSGSSSGETVSFEKLAFGSWTVSVQAYNDESPALLIGEGSAEATVHTGETTEVTVTVSPLPGEGTLDLEVSWNAEDIETPSIGAELIPVSGQTRILDFTLSGAAGSYLASDVASGYHTLTLQLLDNGIVTAGAVEVVRIVTGQPTSGTFAFTQVNKPGGTIEVSIDPQLGDPIGVTISGVSASISEGETMTVSASVEEGAPNVSYVWYLNGASIGTGSSMTFGSTLTAGYYRLDVTAVSVDGTRAGSATESFQVTTPPSAVLIITTVAGNGTQGYSGDGGRATSAQLNCPYGVAIDAAGTLYIAEGNNAIIRSVDTSGTITTVAGNGTPGYSGDGAPATSAQLFTPTGVSFDASRDLYIADSKNAVIRKVDTSGTIATVAGNGTLGYSGDGGPAISAQLDRPTGVSFDTSGNLYIADYYNFVIRKVDTLGTISTVAGNGTQGYSGDGGPATSAQLNYPFGVTVDASDNLYIADSQNNVIRKVDTAGTISTVAGDGSQGYSGDGGLATSAQLYVPTGVFFDALGNLCIADAHNCVIRKVDTVGRISTVAGNGTPGYSGDGGPATSAQLYYPFGVAVDASGTLYVADADNNVVRKVEERQ